MILTNAKLGTLTVLPRVNAIIPEDLINANVLKDILNRNLAFAKTLMSASLKKLIVIRRPNVPTQMEVTSVRVQVE
jgi:hypothetical protein